MTEATMIIPTRHRPQLLEATIRSLQASASEATRGNRHRVRILVVDDAPEDDLTKDLVTALGVDYLRVEEHDGRKDPGAAIILGTSHVDTEFQSLFGDDDIALIRHLPTAFEKLATGEFDVVSNSFHVADSRLSVTNSVVLRPTGLEDIVQGITALNDGSFVRHDLIRDFDFDPSLEAHMLPPMWAHVMLSDARFCIIDEPTWLYRRHDTNLSSGALSERDLGLRRRSNDRVRAMVLERLGRLPGAFPEVDVPDEPALDAAPPVESPPVVQQSPNPTPAEVVTDAGRPLARGLRYRVLNKAARVFRNLSDKAVEASRLR